MSQKHSTMFLREWYKSLHIHWLQISKEYDNCYKSDIFHVIVNGEKNRDGIRRSEEKKETEKEQEEQEKRVVKQEKGRKRRGKARTCDMVEGRRWRKTMRKFRRRKKGPRKRTCEIQLEEQTEQERQRKSVLRWVQHKLVNYGPPLLSLGTWASVYINGNTHDFFTNGKVFFNQ